MARRHISQREAHDLQKQITALRDERRRERASWTSDYPNGIHLASWEPSEWLYHSIKTARRLGFPIVVTLSSNDGKINFHIVKGN